MVSHRILVVDDNLAMRRKASPRCCASGGRCPDGARRTRGARSRPRVRAVRDLPGYRHARNGRLRGGDAASASARSERVLLIALTGYGGEQDRIRADQAGFDRHVTKPVDPAGPADRVGGPPRGLDRRLVEEAEVLRRVRDGERVPPFDTALTGSGQESDRQKTREAGFAHHLVKPLDLEAIDVLLAGDEPTVAGDGKVLSPAVPYRNVGSYRSAGDFLKCAMRMAFSR